MQFSSCDFMWFQIVPEFEVGPLSVRRKHFVPPLKALARTSLIRWWKVEERRNHLRSFWSCSRARAYVAEEDGREIATTITSFGLQQEDLGKASTSISLLNFWELEKIYRFYGLSMHIRIYIEYSLVYSRQGDMGAGRQTKNDKIGGSWGAHAPDSGVPSQLLRIFRQRS